MDFKYDVCWDVKATKQLKKIYKYLKKNTTIEFAEKVRNQIAEKVRELSDQPERYPPEPLLSHRNENLRFLIVKPYKVIYQVYKQEVRILFIYSTRQSPKFLTDNFE